MCVSCEKSCCKDCASRLNTTDSDITKQPEESRSYVQTERENDSSIKIICPYYCGENLSDETYYAHLNSCKNTIKTLQCKNCNKNIEPQASNQGGNNDHLGVCKKNCKLCEKNFYLMNYYHPKSKCPELLMKMFEKSLQSMRENQNVKNLVECA